MPRDEPAETRAETAWGGLEQQLERHSDLRPKIAEIRMETDGTIVAGIVTVDGSPVQKLAFSRCSGLVRQERQQMGAMMRGRFLAIGLLVGFLVLTGALFSMPWLLRDRVPVAGPGTLLSFSEETESALIAVRLQVINRAGDFSLVVEIESEEDAAPPPRLVFGMPAHEMELLEPALSTFSKGRFSATARFAMPGRWEMRILRGHETHAFEFVVRP